MLLIDANFHKPTQQLVFRPWILGHWKCPGLIDVMTEQTPIDNAVIEVMPNLKLLLAGNTTSHSLITVETQPMTDLLQQLRTQYDYILLDTPSLSIDSSASLLGEVVDRTLLVVRPGASHSHSSGYIKSLMEHSQRKLLGLIVNATSVPDLVSWLREQISTSAMSETSHVHSNGSVPKEAVLTTHN